MPMINTNQAGCLWELGKDGNVRASGMSHVVMAKELRVSEGGLKRGIQGVISGEDVFTSEKKSNT